MATSRPQTVLQRRIAVNTPEQVDEQSAVASGSTLGRSVGRSALVMFSAQWAGKATSTLTIIVLTRLLGPEDFGLVAVATVLVAVLTAITDQGFGVALTRHPQLTPRHLSTGFWTAVLSGLTLSAVVILVAEPAAVVLGDRDAAPILRLMGLNPLIAAFSSVQMAVMKREFRFKAIAVRNIASTIGAAMVSIGLAFAGAGAFALAAQLLVGSALGAMLLWRASDWRPSWVIGWAEFKELWGFGVSVTGSRLLQTANRNADNFIISVTLGSTALGFYTVAYRFYRVIIDAGLSSVTSVALPGFASIQDDQARTRRALYQATRFSALAATPIFAGIGLIAPVLIPVVFGPRWEPAIVATQLLVINGIILSVNQFHGSVILARGLSRTSLALNVGRVAVNVVGYLIGVRFGIEGVAASVSITTVVFWPVQLTVLNRIVSLSMRRYFSQFVVPLTGVAAMAAAVLAAQAQWVGTIPDAALLLLLIAIGAAAYGAVVVLLDLATIKQIMRLVGRRKTGQATSETQPPPAEV